MNTSPTSLESEEARTDPDADYEAIPALMAENRRLCSRVEELIELQNTDVEKHKKKTCLKSCPLCKERRDHTSGMAEIAAILAVERARGLAELQQFMKDADNALEKKKRQCLREIRDLHEDLMPISELQANMKQARSFRID